MAMELLRSSVTKGWKGLQHVDLGLVNMGMSGARNACIQVLFHTPLFIRWLEIEQLCSNGCNCLKCLFVKLLPAFRCEPPSTELVCCLLEDIQVAFPTGNSLEPFSFLLGLLSQLHHNCLGLENCSIEDNPSATDNMTPIFTIFGGTLRTVGHCPQCSSITSDLTQMLCLQLDIEAIGSIQEAVTKTLGTSTKSSWCETCKTMQNIEVFSSFEKHPAVLCIRLQRYAPNGAKIKKHVELSHALTLPDITGYNFVAALLLTGETQTCGHSLALVKCSNGKLLLVNDTALQKKSYIALMTSEVCCNAYVVVYELLPSKVAVPEVTRSKVAISKVIINENQEKAVNSESTISSESIEPLNLEGPLDPLCSDDVVAISTVKSWKVTHVDEEIEVERVSSHDCHGTLMSPCDPNKKTRPSTRLRTRDRKTVVHKAVLSYEQACLKMNNKSFKSFTGLSKSYFHTLFKMLGGEKGIKRLMYQQFTDVNSSPMKLSPRSRLLLMLIRLKRGLPFKDLALLFNVSVSQVTTVVYTMMWAVHLALSAQSKAVFVSAVEQNEGQVLLSSFPNLRAVIEGVEFQIPKTSDTVKCAIAASLSGDILYVSSCFEKSVSYSEVIKISGILDWLKIGDAVIVSNKFDIASDLHERGITQIDVPAKGDRSNCTTQEEILAKATLSSRMYSEYAAKTINYWRLLRFAIPMRLCYMLTDVVFISAFLTNDPQPIRHVKYKMRRALKSL